MNQAATAERYPVPPEDLRWRATGSRDAEGFLASSRAGVDFFDKEALARQRKSFKDFNSILDFGCGCGRLIRSLRPFCDPWASIYGTDIDPAAIAWCKDNIADASFSMNGANPPLRFEDKSMDLIYACSVFTHLDTEDQFHWLAELQRILKPDGYLLLTFRYRYNIDQLTDQAVRDRIWEDLDRDGVAFLPAEMPSSGRTVRKFVWRGISQSRVRPEELGQVFRGVRHHHSRRDHAGDGRSARPRVELSSATVSIALGVLGERSR